MLRETTGPVWLDGELVAAGEAKISLFDPALQRGVGLFETLAVLHGECLDLGLHLARLQAGARALALAEPPAARVVDAVNAVRPKLPHPAWLKIILTGGGHLAVFGGGMDAAEVGASVTAVILPWRRSTDDPHVGLKTVNYAAAMAGMEWARRRGADEGLWLNTRGHLAEACTANLFVVRRGCLFTPGRREGILPGTVRRRVLEAAVEIGVAVHEGRVRVPRLLGADEAFLSSSLRGLRPLVRVEGRPLAAGRPGPWTARLATVVARLRQAAAGTHIT